MATTAELITQLYVGYYNRAPDPEGLNYWIGRANAGVSMADIANSFAASPEAIATYPYLAFPNVANAETFLEQVYQNLFNRSIDADGREYYANKLATGQTTPGQIIAEIQANANTNPNNTDGQVLANKVTVGLDFALEAAATPGFEYEGAAVNQANTVLDNVTDTQASVDAALASNDTFFDGGITTPPVTLTAGVDSLTGSVSNDTFVASNATLQVADKIAGGAGFDTLNYVDSSAAGGAVPAADISGVEKIAVRAVGGNSGTTGTSEVQQVPLLGTVTDGANPITFLGTTVPGNTVATGASAADVATAIANEVALNGFSADMQALGITGVQANGSTLVLTYDSARGNVANLGAQSASNGVSSAAASEVTAGAVGVPASGGAVSLDASLYAGLDEVWSDRSTQNLTVTNLAAGDKVGLAGNGSVVLGGLTATYVAAATTGALAFEGGVKAGSGTDVSVAGGANLTTVNISSKSGANSVDNIALAGSVKTVNVDAASDLTIGAGDSDGITGVAADTVINVSGAGKVNLDTLTANVKEVNASANTGGVTVVLEGAGDKFTGGAGNDTVTLAAAPTADVAGGAGTGDRLVVKNSDFIDAPAEVAKISGFEILREQQTGAFALDVSTIAGLTALEVNGTGGATFTGVGAQTVSIIGDNVGNVTVTKTGINPGGNDALAINLDNSVGKFADGVDAGSITVANIDTLTINSVGGNLTGTNSNSVNGLANTDLETVVVTGDTALSITTGTGTLDTINASAFTGALTVNAAGNGVVNITSGSGDDTLIGSSNADVINGGAGKDLIQGGAGNDTITTGAGVDTVHVAGTLNTVAAGGVNTITDFTVGAGGDLLSFGNFNATTDSASGAAVLQQVSSAPNSGVTFQTGTNNVLEFAFDLQGNGVAGQDLDNFADGTGLLAALNQGVSVATNDAGAGILVAYQGGNAYVYTVSDTGDADAGALQADEVSLVGVLQNVAVGSVTADNFTAIA